VVVAVVLENFQKTPDDPEEEEEEGAEGAEGAEAKSQTASAPAASTASLEQRIDRLQADMTEIKALLSQIVPGGAAAAGREAACTA